MIKQVLLCLALAAIAAEAGVCRTVVCRGHNDICVPVAGSPTSGTVNLCQSGHCNPITNKCKPVRSPSQPCYSDEGCDRSRCLMDSGLCWDPNNKAGLCSKDASCELGVVCDRVSEFCQSPWQQSSGVCGKTAKAGVSEYLCKGSMYCGPSNQCTPNVGIGAVCSLASTFDGADDPELLAENGTDPLVQIDYIETEADLIAMSYNPCGGDVCMAGKCVARYTIGVGVACSFNSECQTGICGQDGKCASYSTYYAPCDANSGCENGQVCRCNQAGAQYCYPKYYQAEIDTQRNLYNCFKTQNEKDNCYEALYEYKYYQRLYDSNPCSSASTLSAVFALVVSLVSFL